MSEEKLYYYVALHHANRRALIAGPFDSEEAAQAAKDRAWARACEADPWAWFYTASLARSPERLPTTFGTDVEMK